MELRVKVEFEPALSPENREMVENLIDQEVRGFEHHYCKLQQERGFAGEPLATIERAAVKAYLIYAATEH